jgi:hypothetical protein
VPDADVVDPGILTQATRLPDESSQTSMSWSSFVVPSSSVKRMSSPSAWAPAWRSASVIETMNGKSVSVAMTCALSIVIFLRDDQAASYHPAA